MPRQRLPCFFPMSNRYKDNSTDAFLKNGYVEKGSARDDIWVQKRPGYTTYSQPSGTVHTGQGCYWWNGNLYSVWAGQLYKDSTLLGRSEEHTSELQSPLN